MRHPGKILKNRVQVLSQNWPLDETRFWPGKSYDLDGYVDVIGRYAVWSIFIYFSAAGKKHPQYGRPNILNLRYLDEIARINSYIIHNLTIPVTIEGKEFEVASRILLDLKLHFRLPIQIFV